MLQDQIAGFVKAIFLIDFTNGGKQAPPGEFFKAEDASLGLEVAPEHRQGVVNGCQHRLECAAVNSCHHQGGMQAIFASALAIQGNHFAFNPVQTGRQRLLHLFEHLLLAFISPLSHVRIRMRTQVDQRRQRQRQQLAIHFKIDTFLRSEHALQVIPGTASRERQFIGEDFFWLGH